jgi:hypothetical protein
MSYFFSDNKDSIKIITCKKFDSEGYPIDTTAMFNSTYFLSKNDSILTLKGKKNDTLINAVYKKLPIDGHDWWW